MMDNSLLLMRSSNSVFFYLSVQIILLAFATWNQYRGNVAITLINVFYTISTFIILYTIGDLSLRTCNLMGDLMIKQNDMSVAQLVETRFNYNIVSVIVISICLICVTIEIITGKKENTFKETWTYDTVSFCYLGIVAFIFYNVSVFPNQTLVIPTKSSFINSMEGLDYGTGMAYSFYYGYLKIILPSTGTSSKGLLEKIENFEDTHNVTIAAKKLFLLIPSSTYLPPDLREVSDQWMESTQELEEKRDRAGIKGRSYKNNIYKIYPGGQNSNIKPVYVVVEGATPMLTYFEVQKHYHPESKIYKQYRKEIISSFTQKLKNLLNDDPECRNLCELIYYDDYHSNGKTKVNVAKVILERLAELEETE